MAKKIVNQGLQFAVGRLSNTADSFGALQSMSVDDSTVAFAAGDTALNSGGAVSNEADANFDVTPTRSAQTTTHTATFGTGVSLTIKRIALHNAVASSVTTSSTTLFGGIDGQSLVKDSGYSLVIKVTIAATST